MIGVHLEIVRPASEGAADVLGVSLPLAIVDDFHRVLALEVWLGAARAGIDRVHPEIRRHVAVE